MAIYECFFSTSTKCPYFHKFIRKSRWMIDDRVGSYMPKEIGNGSNVDSCKIQGKGFLLLLAGVPWSFWILAWFLLQYFWLNYRGATDDENWSRVSQENGWWRALLHAVQWREILLLFSRLCWTIWCNANFIYKHAILKCVQGHHVHFFFLK